MKKNIHIAVTIIAVAVAIYSTYELQRNRRYVKSLPQGSGGTPDGYPPPSFK